MLELGVGCDMTTGPGASYYTWLEYFPHADLYYIESDAACAAQWANRTTGATVFAGDQANVAFLDRFISETTGGDKELFDIVIVDDGEHVASQQQQTSLRHLFKIVKPGGLYFLGNLRTSYDGSDEGEDVAKGMGEGNG